MNLLNKKEVIDPDPLALACYNLLQRFNVKADLGKLNEQIKSIPPLVSTVEIWTALPKFTNKLALDAVGSPGSWPSSNDAIVKFQYRSLNEPNVEVEGLLQANIISMYCLVVDAGERTIVDPNQGVITVPTDYGLPVSWASYVPLTKTLITTSKPERTYVVVAGDNVWEIARRYRTTAEILMEHNNIAKPEDLTPGTLLHLPIAKPEADKPIRYDVLDVPKPMHVILEAGTTKWSFGNVHTWKDVQPTGSLYPKNTNVDIAAIAHVPIEDKTAAYYMDTLALGDYKTTSKVNYNIGFNHTHLSDGHVEKVSPVPDPVVEPKTVEKKRAQVLDNIANKINQNAYKTTYKPLNDKRESKIYLANQTIMVHELDGRRPDKPFYQHQGVEIFGTFEKDGVLYGRPTTSVDNGYWFGIPMDAMTIEDDLYNTHIDLPTRVAMKGRLSLQEHGVVVLSKVLSQYTRLVSYFKKKE